MWYGIQWGAGIAVLVFDREVKGMHITSAMEFADETVSITEPELVLRADTLSVRLLALAKSVIVTDMVAVVFLRDLHPLTGGLEIDALGFTLVCVVCHKESPPSAFAEMESSPDMHL